MKNPVADSHVLKKGLLACAAVLVLGGAAVGVVSAQPQPATNGQAPARQKFEEALSKRLHISVDQLKQAMAGARQDVHGHRPPRNFRGFPGGGMFLSKEADAVAALFNESTDQFKAELPGATLAELATKHNTTPQAVTDRIVKMADDQLNQVAQQRNMPADRVSRIKQQISERAQQFVTTHRFPARGSGTRS